MKKECVNLRAAEQPPAWPHVAAAVAPRCPAKTGEIRSLLAAVRADVPEFRRAESLAYPLAGRIGLIVMAMAQGVMRGPQDLADYAATLRQGQLGRRGFTPTARAARGAVPARRPSTGS